MKRLLIIVAFALMPVLGACDSSATGPDYSNLFDGVCLGFCPYGS